MGTFSTSPNDFFHPKNNFFSVNNIFHKLSGDPGKERKCQRPPTHAPHGHTVTISRRKVTFLTKIIKKWDILKRCRIFWCTSAAIQIFELNSGSLRTQKTVDPFYGNPTVGKTRVFLENWVSKIIILYFFILSDTFTVPSEVSFPHFRFHPTTQGTPTPRNR